MQTAIMFATNSTSLILGRRLLSYGHNLKFFCPNDTHLHQASTIPADLMIAAVGLQTDVGIVASAEDLSNMDIIIFPTMDVLPHHDLPYLGDMCGEVFR